MWSNLWLLERRLPWCGAEMVKTRWFYVIDGTPCWWNNDAVAVTEQWTIFTSFFSLLQSSYWARVNLAWGLGESAILWALQGSSYTSLHLIQHSTENIVRRYLWCSQPSVFSFNRAFALDDPSHATSKTSRLTKAKEFSTCTLTCHSHLLTVILLSAKMILKHSFSTDKNVGLNA